MSKKPIMSRKKLFVIGSLWIALSMTHVAAHAQAAAVVAAISSLGQSIINMVMNSLTNAILIPLAMKSTATIQGEIAKSTQAQIQAQGAIAQYQIEQQMKLAAADIKEQSMVPDGVCEFINGAETLKNAEASANKETSSTSKKFVVGLNSTNRSALLNSLYRSSLEKYPTEADRQRYGNLPQSEFPGGDIDSMYLFSNKNGRPTYDPGQEDAIKTMIARKTILGMPEPLPPDMEKSNDGRYYEEYRKRLASFYSSAQQGYLSIMATHKPMVNNVSIMEMVESLVNGRFSSKNIAENASRQKPGPILKDIAMMDALRLWMDLQSLKQQEKMLVLLADQQIMMAESIVAKRANDLRESVISRSGYAQK